MGGPSEPASEFEATVWTRDGVPLSLTIRLPDRQNTDGRPTSHPVGGRAARPGFPVILDCHPYRKDDLSSLRGAGLYEYFTDRGIATARLDVRGTGRSGGTLPSCEYSDAEIDDCVEVIAWLAAQPWSNGSVGMWGISWSAINTLLVAARRPPALRACIAVHPSDDLFASDIHYIDGLLHYDLYELSIDLLNGVTPGTDFRLDEQLLADRFDQPPWFASVLAHPRNDGYWQSRSLAPHYERIACPVFLIGGWYDGYHDCVFRLVDQLPVPVRAWVGPWTHVLPHMGGPGEPADWLAEAADWWDRWLRPGPPPGACPHRQVSLFAQDWHAPAGEGTKVTGTWRTSTSWPIPGMTEKTLVLSAGKLAEPEPASPAGLLPHEISIDSPPWIGGEVGHWWGDLAGDQVTLDAECMVFDSGPLTEDVDLLGAPLARLWIYPSAGSRLFARLEDVAPDGRVTLVTGVAAALPRRDSPEAVRLTLHWASWCFPAGHRIRLALSTALWPMFWPASRPGPVRIGLGGPEASSLTLPVPPSGWGTCGGPGAGKALGVLRGGMTRPALTWEIDRSGQPTRFTWAANGSAELGFATITTTQRLLFTVSSDAAEATASGIAAMDIETSGRSLRWQIETSLRSHGGQYRYQFRRLLTENGAILRERAWEYGIPGPQ